MTRELQPCGTAAAYRRHLRHGEDPCTLCREAEGVRQRKGRPKPTLLPCGTRAAYERHRKAGEEPCTPCRIANAAETEYARRERASRVGAEIPHGIRGYSNWGCRCKVCCRAKSVQNRESNVRRRQRKAASDGE